MGFEKLCARLDKSVTTYRGGANSTALPHATAPSGDPELGGDLGHGVGPAPIGGPS